MADALVKLIPALKNTTVPLFFISSQYIKDWHCDTMHINSMIKSLNLNESVIKKQNVEYESLGQNTVS